MTFYTFLVFIILHYQCLYYTNNEVLWDIWPKIASTFHVYIQYMILMS